jgi:hypothetical protein
MNYLLPDEGVLPMHSAVNVGPERDSVVFFGLSGTGKTTLSADPERSLIGDDEHGWGGDGVFNFEGGCYAKTIRLSSMYEPDIFATTKRFGTILENVELDPRTRALDLDSDRITENTRGAYPLDYIGNADPTGIAGQPRNVVLLTADAFGVLPPISKLTHDQAAYHFISGYTAKLAGTEVGVKEPMATFSACFGAPFMPRHPGEYAAMLIERLATYDVPVWLVNTGWTGGPYGTGERMNINHTRTMVRAALNGELDDVATRRDPVFGVGGPDRGAGRPGRDPRSALDLDRRRGVRRPGREARPDVRRQLPLVRRRRSAVRPGGRPGRDRRRRPRPRTRGTGRGLRVLDVPVGEEALAQVALGERGDDADDQGQDRDDDRDRDDRDGGDRQPGDHQVARRLSIVWNSPAANSSDAPRPMTSTRPPPKMPMKMSTTPLMIIAATDWDVSSVRFSICGIVARRQTLAQ